MKKILIAITAAVLLCLTSCGGVYSVSGGKADAAEISFVANNTTDIIVTIDQNDYQLQTVKEKVYRRDKNIKKTANNSITLSPGQHKVIVTNKQGMKIYEHTVFISANQHKVIRL